MTVASIAAHATLLGWLALLPALTARLGRRRALAVAALTLVAGVLLVPAPSALPTASMVELREGRERELLEALWGVDPWFGRWLPRTIVPFRASVWLHRVEAVAAAGLFGGLAWGAVGPVGGALLTVGFATTAWFEHAAASNGPELPLTLGALLAAHAWTLRADPRRAVRGLAVGTTIAVATASAGLRSESLLVTLPAVLATLAPSLPSRRRSLGAWGPPLALVGSSAALLAIGLAVQATAGHRGASERGALPWTPEHLATLRLPLDLLGFASPGFALLALVGLVALSTRSLPALAWAAGTLALARLYALEGHLGAAPYETLRHLALMQGPLALATLAGARATLAATGRPAATWTAVAALTALPRVDAPTGIPRWPGTRIETTQQVGARFLLEVAEAFPRCVLASRTAPEVLSRTGPQDVWTYRWTTVFHGPATAPAPLTEDADRVATELARRHRAEAPTLALPPSWPEALRVAPCVVAVRGVDCALHGADCDAWAEGLVPEVDVVVRAAEHNTHHGGHAAPLRLAAYPVRREAADATTR